MLISKTGFSGALVQHIAQTYGTPVWAYDAAVITQQVAALKRFDTVRYAQKANANTHILRLMRSLGVKVDAVSLGEVERALAAGYVAGPVQGAGGKVDYEVVFTADLLDRPTLARLVALGVPVNCGSADMLDQLGAAAPGHPVWLRINPGFGHGHSNKTNTGGEHSKHGIWHTDLALALGKVKQHGLRLVGLHMHIGSGVDYRHLQEVCGAMVNLVRQVIEAQMDLQAISAGGGLSIPYQESQGSVDTEHYYTLWDKARQEIAGLLGHAVGLEIEPGRYLVAQSGILISEVRAVKQMGSKHFALVDAGFSDLMRPSMYGSYHGMTVVRADGALALEPQRDTVVAGPLCESGDVFTQGEGGVVLTRQLPVAKVGDYLVFEDAGAYGASMSSNYNTRPLIPEVLLQDRQVRLIRRRQTVQELVVLEVV